MQRRHLLGLSPKPVSLTPPWSQPDFYDRCTGCRRCVDACPEQILYLSTDNRAAIQFARGCSLCQACVDHCPTGALALSGPAFPWRAQISSACLSQQQIACRSCDDQCEAQALRFVLRAHQAAQPQIDPDCCTGCGACLAPCPVNAISLVTGSCA